MSTATTNGNGDTVATHLYNRSLAGQWNADRDLDWTQSTAIDPALEGPRARLINELYWSERQSLWTVQRMNIPIKSYFQDHQLSLVASAHTFDESRHVYVLERYCRKIGALAECPTLWEVLTRMADFMGASVVNYFHSVIISETLGEVLFSMLRHARVDPLLKQICTNALRDEARHIAYITEGLRRIKARSGRLERLRTRALLLAMLFFGLRSLRRTEADAQRLGIGRDEFLDYFERKLIGSIRRAQIEDVLSPSEIHRIVQHYRASRGDLVDEALVQEITDLEDGTHESLGDPGDVDRARLAASPSPTRSGRVVLPS